MANVADLRRMALALPETTEGTHFGMVSFKVRGKSFAGVDKDGRGGFEADPSQVPALIAENPAAAEEVRRFDKLIGPRVDLAKVFEQRLARLVELAWRHKAPKRLVAAWDARAGGKQ